MNDVEEMDKTFVRCFSTRDGQAVLEYLRNTTIEQATWFPGDDPSHGFHREGQNSLVRDIEKRIKRGREA